MVDLFELGVCSTFLCVYYLVKWREIRSVSMRLGEGEEALGAMCSGFDLYFKDN